MQMTTFPFSVVAHEITRMMKEGRRPDAIEEIMKHLRTVLDDEKFLQIVADLLKPEKKGRGGVKKDHPPN